MIIEMDIWCIILITIFSYLDGAVWYKIFTEDKK